MELQPEVPRITSRTKIKSFLDMLLYVIIVGKGCSCLWLCPPI